MKIVTLTENTACHSSLLAEHGLSLYIEAGEAKLLFDAGQTDAFARNADALGVDLSRVDAAIVSHGHYDHGGGLPVFLERNASAPVYVQKDAFGEHYHGSEKYIGLEPSLRLSSRLIPVDGICEIAPGITLHSCHDRPLAEPIRPFGLTRKEGSRFLAEDFRHEQYLLIEEKGKRILISGCSHRGIRNILKWFRPDVVVGGFHFMKLDPEGAELREAAYQLLALPIRYYTCHCTGLAQYDAMKEILGDRLQYLSAGTVLEL